MTIHLSIDADCNHKFLKFNHNQKQLIYYLFLSLQYNYVSYCFNYWRISGNW